MYSDFIQNIYLSITNNIITDKSFNIKDLSIDYSKDEKEFLDNLCNRGAFFIEKLDEFTYKRTFRIEEACIRTVDELQKENIHPDIMSYIEKNPLILHDELKRWFDSKHSSMLSYILDKYWHNFVLYAKEYEDWCKINYGCMMYHSPKFLFEKENFEIESVIDDSIKFFKQYKKMKFPMEKNILLYNVPYTLYNKNIKFEEIKNIIFDLIED